MSHQIDPTLIPFFNPTGIAVIGASTAPAKLSFGVARNLAQSGYTGAIHFVNPKGGRLLERPMHAAIADLPDPVDLAVIIVPAPMVPDTLDAVGRRGIRGQSRTICSGGHTGFRARTGCEAGSSVQQLRIATRPRAATRATLIPREDLPGLRLPLPVDRRRRRAVDAQPRRGTGRRRPRGHLLDP